VETSAYVITQNGTQVQLGLWSSGQWINLTETPLVAGVYNFTLNATDGIGGMMLESVIVTVFADLPPTINNSGSFTFTVGSTGNMIWWYLTDDVVQTTSYTLYKNGQVLTSGIWSSNQNITLNIDGLAATANYTLVAEDGLGGITQSSIIITVPVTNTSSSTTTDNGGNTNLLIYGIIGGVVVVAIVGIILGTRKRKPQNSSASDKQKTNQPPEPSKSTPSDNAKPKESIASKLTPISSTSDSWAEGKDSSAYTHNILSKVAQIVPDTAKILAQFEGLKKVIANLDADFDAGKLTQEQYLEKKDFLGQEMGKLMAEMDTKGIHYDL
jgi:hypothetical protein